MLREPRVPNGKDARMNPVQAPPDPSPDPVIIESEREQLPAADHPVLSRGDPREPHLRVCAGNLALSASFMPHTPMVAEGVLREGAVCYWGVALVLRRRGCRAGRERRGR